MNILLTASQSGKKMESHQTACNVRWDLFFLSLSNHLHSEFPFINLVHIVVKIKTVKFIIKNSNSELQH